MNNPLIIYLSQREGLIRMPENRRAGFLIPFDGTSLGLPASLCRDVDGWAAEYQGWSHRFKGADGMGPEYCGDFPLEAHNAAGVYLLERIRQVVGPDINPHFTGNYILDVTALRVHKAFNSLGLDDV